MRDPGVGDGVPGLRRARIVTSEIELQPFITSEEPCILRLPEAKRLGFHRRWGRDHLRVAAGNVRVKAFRPHLRHTLDPGHSLWQLVSTVVYERLAVSLLVAVAWQELQLLSELLVVPVAFPPLSLSTLVRIPLCRGVSGCSAGRGLGFSRGRHRRSALSWCGRVRNGDLPICEREGQSKDGETLVRV